MGTATDVQAERAAALVDELSCQQRVLACAQARQAELMVQFAALRHDVDVRRIADRTGVGISARYEPGEFAATEIGLAVKVTKFSVQRTMGITRRLQEEAPQVWDAWLAGDVDLRRAGKISSALLRLTRDSSKRLLNLLVVPVATCKTAELLGRWLNEFVAKVEPDQTNERLRRSFADRYVSVRPDVDGISFLSAAISAVDADAVDQVLNAVAGLAEPGDRRTWAQRRADVLVDLVLGRVSNGCHVAWEDDEFVEDDEEETHEVEVDDPERAERAGQAGQAEDAVDERSDGPDAGKVPDDAAPEGADLEDTTAQDVAVQDEWDLPPSAFRPDPRNQPTTYPADHADHADPALPGTGPGGPATQPRDPERPGRPVITPCPQPHPARPLPVTIGVIITIQSLFGYTDTPGQLADRSALIPADTIRDYAHQPGTLFYQLLTDQAGNLLATTELGRFPSRTLGHALTFRDGTCTNPICTVPGRRCDLDHLQPAPSGPTAAHNLDNKCRGDHRAKTHAGHHSTRTTPHTNQWTTPTGHTYTTPDPPLPAENWPDPTPEPDPTPPTGPTPEPDPTPPTDPNSPVRATGRATDSVMPGDPEPVSERYQPRLPTCET
ncbi:hypothetical protein ABIB25_001653 [Nakamurella sp. UYEF19]|uniref:DUF222 domain-containing protein n=1 Tax=Nakamurella sp. UYEF19 TaxID=1756392 RepID=UPI0033922190